MGHLRERGKIRNVGVSNFSAAHHVSDVPIAVNQIVFHPQFQRPELVEYCRETETVIEAAAPLARTEMLTDEADVRRLDDLDRDQPVYDTPTRDWTDDVYGIAE